MFLTMIAMAAAMPATDPLAPARRGLVQCRGVHEDRTCEIMVDYTPLRDGSYRSRSRVLYSNVPNIVIEAYSTVRIENGQVCDRDFAGKMHRTRLLMDGVPAPADITADFHQRYDSTMTPFEGATVCATYEDGGRGGWSATVIVDGAEYPDLGSRFIWVRPDQYRLAPAPSNVTVTPRHQTQN